MAQENGHGYLVTKGGEAFEMDNLQDQIVAHEIPNEPNKCIVSVTYTYATNDAKKAAETVDGFMKLHEQVITKNIPEMVKKGMMKPSQ